MTDTPLGEKLRRLIRTNGPISVAEFMAMALGDPEHGYYMTRDPFGAAGDFVTAPDVSQMFGELIGAWLAETWRIVGAPSPVALVELGPGRGTLMADMLRVAAKVPDFHAALAVHLVETSPKLRALQRTRLAGVSATWHDTFAAVPAGPTLLVANEFFDALPVRHFLRDNGAWRERVIGLGADGALAFVLGAGGLAEGPEASDGSVLEMRPAADALMGEIAARIAAQGGAALVIDYGHTRSAFGETLQAMQGHRFVDPLDSPGEADLTAHVDFAALARAAAAAGASVHGPVTQGAFLQTLGLGARAARLAASASPADIKAAVERLAGPESMGTLFKVMGVAPREVALPGLSP